MRFTVEFLDNEMNSVFISFSNFIEAHEYCMELWSKGVYSVLHEELLEA